MIEKEIVSIKSQTGWSDEIIESLSSVEEAEIYIRAGLKEAVIGGKVALIRTDIDWADYSIRRNTWLRDSTQQALKDYDSWAQYNNADLIGEGFPPRDRNGDPYELHHIGQRQDSPFAELTWAEHMGGGNNVILHRAGKESEINRGVFDKEKAAYWMARYKAFTKEELERIYRKG
ncbi:MAG: HNH/ENDO VII family nuclease [Bacteroidales bacterium]|nr:HNH/ENDO VII family nuclease [Bacteroidales bacterium]